MGSLLRPLLRARRAIPARRPSSRGMETPTTPRVTTATDHLAHYRVGRAWRGLAQGRTSPPKPDLTEMIRSLLSTGDARDPNLALRA
jgi:hypothetical protein